MNNKNIILLFIFIFIYPINCNHRVVSFLNDEKTNQKRLHIDLSKIENRKIKNDTYIIGHKRLNGKLLTGYAHLLTKHSPHYHHHDKPEINNNMNDISVQGNCFKINSLGAKWKTPLRYGIDTTNIAGLSSSFIITNINNAYTTWKNILLNSNNLGIYDPTIIVDGANLFIPDGKNEILFGTISQSSAVAITITWGVFNSNEQNNEIVEQDIVFDDSDYDFGDANIQGNSVIDFLSVAVHEIGHALGGLDDLTMCPDHTMFGSISFGETIKRSLEFGDRDGIRVNYGQQEFTPQNNNNHSLSNNLNSNISFVLIVLIIYFIFF